MIPTLQNRLDALSRQDLHRAPTLPPEGCLDFSSNDYLNLARDPRVTEAAATAARKYGAGARAARLMSGNLSCHQTLENHLAEWTGQESALLFGSGFLTNSGLIPALAQKGDIVFADKLVHASAIEGLRHSDATFFRFRHNDLNHLSTLLKAHHPASGGLRLIVTESVFSMDGDQAPLRELMTLAKSCGGNTLVLIDEAHALGVFGKHGAGLCSTLPPELAPDIIVGTLGKALGSYGGFCACKAEIRDYLINQTRTFIFSTALPPPVVAAADAALSICREGNLGNELLSRTDCFAKALGLPTSPPSQIIPLVIGPNAKAIQTAKRLRDEGILVTAIRPPTVPPGTARLRLSVTLALSERELQRAARAIAKELV